jgi:predicted RNase H-like HicB family nuclease
MPEISQIPGFRFTSPLAVSIEREGEGYWLARVAALDLWADGATEEEALLELRTSLTHLAADIYDAPLARLGPVPQRWQAYLRQVAVKTG